MKRILIVLVLQRVLQFWLDRGVDGFRVDAIATLFEVEDLSLNEEPSMIEGALPVGSKCYRNPKYFCNFMLLLDHNHCFLLGSPAYMYKCKRVA